MSGGDVDTLADVVEALAHLHEVPEDERGAPWYAYRDTLEAARAKAVGQARETR